MQWAASSNAGFCPPGIEPWLPISDDATVINVAVQQADAGSLLTLYRQLIDLRRREPALQIGRYCPRSAERDILAYEREQDGRRLLVVLNLGTRPCFWDPTDKLLQGRILVSTRPNRSTDHVAGCVALAADEGVIVELA